MSNFCEALRQKLLSALGSLDEIKGEITLLIGKLPTEDGMVAADSPARLSIPQRLAQIMAEENLDEKAALKKVAKERGISKSEAYREWQRRKIVKIKFVAWSLLVLGATLCFAEKVRGSLSASR